MQFIYPIGLFAAAAIIIPVIIHLWNVTQSKTLKIGSIALLGESSRQSSKSLRVTDWPLLLLRCWLLIILAFFLAKPFIRNPSVAGSDKGWVMIEKSTLKRAYNEEKKTIDSLLNTGYELHELNIGFAEINLADSSDATDDTVRILSYPSLLKQLNATLPAGFKVYAFAKNKLNRYEGNLPQVSVDLKWKMISTPDSITTWISRVYFTEKGNIRAFLTHSSPSGNYTETFELNDQTAKAKKIELRVDSGITKLKTADQANWITADTSSINVAIYVTGEQNDAAYIKSAMMAIRQYTELKINVSTVNNSSTIPASSDLVFWLSDADVDPKVARRLKKNAGIFSYESGKLENINSIINTAPQTERSVNHPALYKRTAISKSEGDILWSDGFGFPVLTMDQSEDMKRYHFYTRFDPQYSNLVWSNDFVKALMPVVIPSIARETLEYNELDIRQMADNHFLHSAGFKTGKFSGVYTDKSLNNVMWLIAMLLFTAERVVTFSRSKSEI